MHVYANLQHVMLVRNRVGKQEETRGPRKALLVEILVYLRLLPQVGTSS